MITLHNGDCLEVMKTIPNNSIDMILCDLPYGTTQNKWDAIIPFDALWKEYERITKDNSAIVLFSSGLFTAKLMLSNEKLYKYSLVWKKGERVTGFLNAKRMPLRNHEDILVFYKKQPTYNPQFTEGKENHGRGTKIYSKDTTSNYGNHKQVDGEKTNLKYPKSVLNFEKNTNVIHPTQKPVALLEYLVKTYSNEGDTILDNTMGSGSTGVACINTKRNFIGIEMDETYFKAAKERIEEAERNYNIWEICENESNFNWYDESNV